jgi:hypothetical protein
MNKFTELKKRFIDGDNVALIDVLRISIHLNKPLPEWARGEVLGALDGWRSADYVSLDEAFGVKREQFRQEKERRILQTLPTTYFEIEDLIKCGFSSEKAFDELARRRNPDDPNYQKAVRTIRRDYALGVKEFKPSDE